MNTVTPRCDASKLEPELPLYRVNGCLPPLLLIALFVFWWLA